MTAFNNSIEKDNFAIKQYKYGKLDFVLKAIVLCAPPTISAVRGGSKEEVVYMVFVSAMSTPLIKELSNSFKMDGSKSNINRKALLNKSFLASIPLLIANIIPFISLASNHDLHKFEEKFEIGRHVMLATAYLVGTSKAVVQVKEVIKSMVK
ncbi:MAG TPA: hypothetical protein DIC60_00040 [Lachnospiraceae bacterium]|nr:hypothetical protein [Lachnospiraceae bacterium]